MCSNWSLNRSHHLTSLPPPQKIQVSSWVEQISLENHQKNFRKDIQFYFPSEMCCSHWWYHGMVIVAAVAGSVYFATEIYGFLVPYRPVHRLEVHSAIHFASLCGGWTWTDAVLFAVISFQCPWKRPLKIFKFFKVIMMPHHHWGPSLTH